MQKPIKRVRIPRFQDHEGIYQYWANLYWICPVCGGPRGEVFDAFSYDGSCRMLVNGWENPCGHLDYYMDLRLEANRNGLNNYDDNQIEYLMKGTDDAETT